MLVVQDIREYKDQYSKALQKRNFDGEAILTNILELDESRKSIQSQIDNELAQVNTHSSKIGQLMKQGSKAEAEELKAKVKDHKVEAETLNSKLSETVEELSRLLYSVPNIPHQTVPVGNTEDDNEEVFKNATIPDFDFDAVPHWELAKKYDLIDFELGVKIAGAGFPVYKGKGARLQRALITYFLDKNTTAGYTEYQVPFLVNEASGYGTGQLPDKEGQMYHVTGDDLYLIPTAEVPVTNMFRDVIIKEADLPLTCTAYTPCFRREAGSYGAHVRGLNRLHQFDKVEIVRIEKPQNSYAALDSMVEHVQKILEELELPYRILRLCAGDLGFTSALTYDFEIYSAAQERWLEVSSVSNFESFQANRLKLRFKDQDGKKKLAHTLNGSALALPRILAGILENFQTKNGIQIPAVLIPYCGFDKIE